MMVNAIRLFTKVKDGKIIVDLPEGMQVEVIVIPQAKTDNTQPTSIAAEPTLTYERLEKNDNVLAFASPPRDNITLETIIKEQGNKKFDADKFRTTSEQIKWEEDMTELVDVVQSI